MKAIRFCLATLVATCAASAASAATVYTYTGTTSYDGTPFEAIFRFDTPYESFTFLVDGTSFGFDSTHLPIHLRHDDVGTTWIAVKQRYIGLDGGHGLSYLNGRFAFGTGWGSAISNYGHPLISNLGDKLNITGLTITTEADLAPGYLDLSGANGPVVPEPATWALMLLGFGAIGSAIRRRRSMLEA